MNGLPGQKPLFETLSIRTTRYDELLNAEALLHGTIRIHLDNDGRVVSPVIKAVSRAIAAGCCTFPELADHLRRQKISKKTRARVTAWLQAVARLNGEAP